MTDREDERPREREDRDPERLRAALKRARAALGLGIDRAAWRAAKRDRLEWESSRRALNRYAP